MDLQDSVRNLVGELQKARAAAEPQKDYQIVDSPIPSEAVSRVLEDPVGIFSDLDLEEETTRVTVIRKPRTGQLGANLVLILWNDNSADFFISA